MLSGADTKEKESREICAGGASRQLMRAQGSKSKGLEAAGHRGRINRSPGPIHLLT